MINYALSLILLISVIPNKVSLEKKFEDSISKASASYTDHEMQDAKTFAFEAYQMAKDHGYDWGITKALFVLAYLHEQDTEYEKALPFYYQALEQYEDYDSYLAILDKSKVLFNIGCIMMANDKYEEAIKFYDQGIQYAQEYELTQMLLDNLHNKIIVCTDAGLFDLAMETIRFKNSLIDISNTVEKLKTRNELGLLYEKLDEIDKAKEEYNSILNEEKSNPTSSFSGKAYINLGRIYDREYKFDLAKDAFKTALKLAEKDQVMQDIFQIHQSLAIIEKKEGNIDAAMSHLNLSIGLFDQVDKTKENIAVFHQISELYLKNGNITEGLLHSERYKGEVSDLLRRQENLNSIGNQYKIDFITSSYFNKIEKRETLLIFCSIIGSMILFFLIYLSYQHYKKVQIAKLIREQMNSVAFDIDEI